MKVTYNWLKEYVDFDLEPGALGDALSMVGLEVEGLEQLGEDISEVVVGEVLECGKHPNADKLSVCKVTDGTDTFNVVCGAPNVRQGLKIAFARVGTQLPDIKLKKAKIRGEVSEGMICSERELHLSDEHEGILELPAESSLGQRLVDVLGLSDWVYEIGLTPNRGDCLGVVGVAREVAAIVGSEVRAPDVEMEFGGDDASSACTVRVDDLERCPRYIARVIRGVTVQPSPAWMARRLEAVGIRSISNVVDVTNYVMMELNQPLHAFDVGFVHDQQIIVRRAKAGEKITTLDDVERALTGEDLVIADPKGPVALAGVMGGAGSGVTDDTSTILLESAYFEPGGVRRTSRRHGLSSDSSYRFERGIDPGGVDFASRRAAQLIASTGGGSVAPGSVDVGEAPEKRRIVVDMGRVNALLGTALDAPGAARLLDPLGLESTPENGSLHARIPTWRSDIERPVDVAEEIARRVGYETIPERIPTQPLAVELPNHAVTRSDRVKDAMCSLGFSEVIHMSFIAPDVRGKLGLAGDDPANKPVTLRNPLNDEEGELRTLLLPSLLDNYSRNLNRGRGRTLRIFELRHVFRDLGGELPDEPVHLCGLLAGSRWIRSWDGEPAGVDFFDAKGAVEMLLEQVGHPSSGWTAKGLPPYVIAGAGATVHTEAGALGWVGEIDPDVLLRFDLDDERVFAFELDAGSLLVAPKVPVFEEIPRYPAVVRDLAVVVDESVAAADLLAVVSKSNPKILENVDIFDIYRGPQIGEGKKSIALSLTYRDPRRTLTDKDVTKAHDRLVRTLQREFDANLRA